MFTKLCKEAISTQNANLDFTKLFMHTSSYKLLNEIWTEMDTSENTNSNIIYLIFWDRSINVLFANFGQRLLHLVQQDILW